MKPFLFLACCLALALPARAAIDPFAEFRVPDHSYRLGSTGFDFFANRHVQSTAGASNRGSSLSTTLDGDFRAGWDSDPLQYGFSLFTAGRLMTSHSRSGSEYPESWQRQEEVGRQAVEDWRLVGTLRSYPWKAPVGLGISASAQGDYSQSWSRSDSRASQGTPEVRRVEARQSSAGHSYQTVVFADLSAGLGRVRDASVVYDVHLLEERLIETGALARPLSAGARAKLAALYYVAPFYSAAHERPDRFVWREIERVLREDGALGEHGLDPYSVLRAREPYVPGGRPMRQRGWFVGLVSQLTTRDYINRAEYESEYRVYDSGVLTFGDNSAAGQRTVSSYDEATLGGEAEYHLPIGWRWQLDAAGRVAGPARPGENGLDVYNRASLDWLVADRWSARAFLSQSRNYFRPRGARGALVSDRWATQIGANLAYYLEDRTSLSLSIAETQERTFYAPDAPPVFYRDGRISLGIAYRFFGSLDAPGLLEPVRPLR